MEYQPRTKIAVGTLMPGRVRYYNKWISIVTIGVVKVYIFDYRIALFFVI